MKITKAIIPAAGSGTRFLPITKTIQKEMLPILAKPFIDLVVDDCISAGITDIIFVIKEGDTQIQDYYSENFRLKAYLEKMGKLDKYAKVEQIHKKAKFTFVTQKDSDHYGTSTPVKLCYDLVKDEEAFLAFYGDDLFLSNSGQSMIPSMIEEFTNSNAAAAITCIDVPKRFVSKYGIAEYREENGHKFLTRQVEKPDPEAVNSTFVTISKFIFTPKIFKYLDEQELDGKLGEMLITTAYSALAQDEKMLLFTPKDCEYLDSGYAWGWLKANLIMAKKDKVLWQEVTDFVKAEFKPQD